MSTSSNPATDGSPPQNSHGDPNPPTYAAFAPTTHSRNPSTQRSTILVHKKSPLLVATPPQITRALAYSHPFLSPLNKIAGLLSWTTGDPWESFLLVAGFWAVILYGDAVIRWAGPIVLVVLLILVLYFRRYSPLSSTGWTSAKNARGHKRGASDTENTHQKTLDEIVDTMKLFTSRCNILLDPWIRMTDFLSTQSTATTATTRPALTALFIRILLVTPMWVLLTLPPLRIITSRRVILTYGTLFLSWHSRPARVSRTILWRSSAVRRICAAITGLQFAGPDTKPKPPPLPPRKQAANEVGASLAAKHRAESPGIRFTFVVYENQRRWLGIGWTHSMLAYERASWTDEHMNPSSAIERFELPEVEGGHARWRWVEGTEWHVEGAEEQSSSDVGGRKGREAMGGWIYYDNKWRDGRKQDGWGRYTRRRKWCRDAEFVEVTSSTEITPSPTPKPVEEKEGEKSSAASEADTLVQSEAESMPEQVGANKSDEDTVSTKKGKRTWFRRRNSQAASVTSANDGSSSIVEVGRRDDEDDVLSPERQRQEETASDWRVSEDVRMGFG